MKYIKYLLICMSLLCGVMSLCAETVHQLICDEPWFSFIKNGIKPVEGRKNSPKYQGIQIDDVIEFINENGESFKAKVVEIRKYPSLEDYLKDATIEKALPGVSSFDDAINIYHEWSTPEEIERYGFLGIFVELIDVQSFHCYNKGSF